MITALPRLASLPVPTRIRDKDWNDAGQLMADKHIPEAEHALFHENLAAYLAHRTCGSPSERWQKKLDRELAHPYTDGEVLNRVDTLQSSLLENLHQLPRIPSKVYLTGSFSRGRLGAHSDLEGYGVLPQPDLKDGFKVYAKRDEGDGANLFPFSADSPGYNRSMLMVAGASVQIDPARLEKQGFLRKVYADVQAHRPEQRRETNPVYEWITSKVWREGLTPQEKVDQFEGKKLSTRVMGWGLSLAGTLSTAPFVGPAIRGVANFMVRQHHMQADDP